MEIIVRNPSAYLLAVTTYRHKPVEYYVGSAWSLGGVKDADEWFETVRRQKDKLSCPLEVYSRKYPGQY